MTDRRAFLTRSLGAVAMLGLSPSVFRCAFAAPAVAGASPYGLPGPADTNGVRLPAGFQARLIGVTGQTVANTSYAWHGQPDGGAVFSATDGGWVYACNSEMNGTRGGASAVRFNADGGIVDAYRILGGTKWNCAGGATPWNTWLSCEEHRAGVVWECDPFKPGQGVPRPAMGAFAHEAAVVDPSTGWVYLTEDTNDSRLYRFRPTQRQNLASGILEAAAVDAKGAVTWIEVSPKRPYRGADTSEFKRGEGAWFANGHLYFCTTADSRVWALETASSKLEVIYDAIQIGTGAPLREPDNVTVHAASGDIFVAEDDDGGDDSVQLVLLANVNGMRLAAPFLQVIGHVGSELTGPAFSPDGSRLYFSSQRGTEGGNNGAGMTFEVTGPFRRT